MKLSVDHVTQYRYDSPVRAATQYLRLVPQDSARQRVIEWALDTPGTLTATTDGYGNILNVLTLSEPVLEIVLRARGIVETRPGPDEGLDRVPLSPLVFTRIGPLTRADAAIAEFAEPFRRRSASVTGLGELALAILKRMPYDTNDTHVATPAIDAFAGGSGVCQDHVHVFLACCRHLGVPARYVSGYVYSAGHAEANTASHAWAEAWVLDRWRSFDISNRSPAGEDHIKLAIGMDYLDACPVRGTRSGGGEEALSVTARVQRQGGEQQ